ncbi:T-cell surface glycoprotein CD3 zeta chain isoform X2 [Denticeps clupeoides]|uniref:T-cell surface glycoprotein CD3 zeta chain isoform X2 n=1 Tax=Denticeps clupeoides TaxID=299321 RepID=UPI0010A4209D|nr:T-cell surface glycoprotein CD3 zeta chain isoform X2 [Denticeps clupeoides]
MGTHTCSQNAGMGLYDPRLCYVLDGFLLIYAILITALHIREKFFKKKSAKDDNIYSDLAAKHDNYDQLTRRDVERGSGGRGRRAPNDDTYTSLNKPSEDTYRSIQTKDRRRNKNEQVYEGLNAATKDTYDKLQMQPLPPAR